MLRCAQSPHSIVLVKYAYRLACPERKPKDRFFARIASEIFLSSLQTQYLSNPLGEKFVRGEKEKGGQEPFELSPVARVIFSIRRDHSAVELSLAVRSHSLLPYLRHCTLQQ
jgi:hypothetical protein